MKNRKSSKLLLEIKSLQDRLNQMIKEQQSIKKEDIIAVNDELDNLIYKYYSQIKKQKG